MGQPGIMEKLILENEISELNGTISTVEDVVLSLLQDTEMVSERLDEIAAGAEQSYRLEQSGKLHYECEEFIRRTKQLSEAIKNAVNRVKNAQSEVEETLLEELANCADKKAETSSFSFVVRENPPSVVVDDLTKIPKKYRNPPKPIPSWEKWPANKNAIKTALTREVVHKIDGVHLERGERVEVKTR
jgi:DNA-binding ferritin-like protein